MVELKNDSIDSRILSWLRFPLAALVVFIHTDYSRNTADAAFYIGTFLSGCVAQIAVPAFFFISGYLFFAKLENYGLQEYKTIMCRKAKTLLVPYLLWIALAYYGYGLWTGFSSDVKPWDFYRIFWAGSDGFTATSPLGYSFSLLCTPAGLAVLWFIRDLIIAMILSPLIWWIVRKCRLYSIVLFLLPYLLTLGIPVKGFGLVALCFFPIGATLSILGYGITDVFVRKRRILISLFAVLLVIKFILDINNAHYHRILPQMLTIVGVAAAFGIAYVALQYKFSEKIIVLGEISFFVYVCHTLPIFYPLTHITNYISANCIGGSLVSYKLELQDNCDNLRLLHA